MGAQSGSTSISNLYLGVGGSLEQEQRVKTGCKMAETELQLALREKQGSFQGEYRTSHQTGEVLFCRF